MGYQNNFLFRDDLRDTGVHGHNGSYCSSPDMIVHKLVNNPQAEFGSNSYNNDPSQGVDRSSMTNPVYTRVKSMQNASGLVKGYIRLYRANSSLFMHPSQWRENKLFTPQGRDYIEIASQNKDDVIVGDDIFSLDGTKENYCIVGIVNDSTAETIPQNFTNYNDFCIWVRGTRSVSVRNFWLEDSGTYNDLENLYSIANPEQSARLGSILVTGYNLPRGTTFGLVNEALNMNKSMVFDPDDITKQTVSDSAYIPGGYSGYVKIYAKLPSGAVWPVNGRLETTFYIAANNNEEMMQFALPVESIINDVRSLEKFGSPGRLVQVGNCQVMFK